MNTINLAKLGGHMNLKRKICTNKQRWSGSHKKHGHEKSTGCLMPLWLLIRIVSFVGKETPEDSAV